MALFGRNRLPHRSTLSRFLAALDQPTVEALRTLFQKDLLARKPFPSPGGLFDRAGHPWLGVDVDGTRATARQRALPKTDALPVPRRRFDQVCAPGYQGRKRGEVVRTRTVILQAHTHQLLGTFGGPGNGDYRGELQRATGVISSYATQIGLSTTYVLVRLDGHDARRRAPSRCALGKPFRGRQESGLPSPRSGGRPAATSSFSRSREHPSGKRRDTSALQLCVRSLDANWTRGTFGSRDPRSHRLCSRCWYGARRGDL